MSTTAYESELVNTILEMEFSGTLFEGVRFSNSCLLLDARGLDKPWMLTRIQGSAKSLVLSVGELVEMLEEVNLALFFHYSPEATEEKSIRARAREAFASVQALGYDTVTIDADGMRVH